MDAQRDLLVIAGPTASGKSTLGLEVADRLGAEIVSADAFAVYRGLDIGTDKPDAVARARVRHHLIDVADPRSRFSAGDFATAAHAAIADVHARGRDVVVVGGTHFYLRALLRGLFPSPPHEPELDARLAAEWDRDPAATYRRLQAEDPDTAQGIGAADRQRVLRALEVLELTGEGLAAHWQRHGEHQQYRPLVVAPERPREELYARIERRAGLMFHSGLVEEVQRLLASGVPRDAHALKAIGYRQVLGLLAGDLDLINAIANTTSSSRRLAKRQLTWLRREDSLRWVPPVEDGGVDHLIGTWHAHGRGNGR
jgi:tRNA dimethylallyltransferase